MIRVEKGESLKTLTKMVSSISSLNSRKKALKLLTYQLLVQSALL